MTMEVSTFEQLSRRMLEDARHTGRPGTLLPFQRLWPAITVHALIHRDSRTGNP